MFCINCRCQLRLERRQLCCIKQDFKYRVLNTPSIAFAEFRYTPKPRCSRFGCCIHIISNNNQHFSHLQTNGG